MSKNNTLRQRQNCSHFRDVFLNDFSATKLFNFYQNFTEICSQGPINKLRPRQNGRHFADDILKCIFLNENIWIPIKISLKFVPKGTINNIPALVKIMAWRRPGDKPLSEPMVVSLLTHICVTPLQSVNNTPEFGQIIAWCQSGDKAPSEPMMA